MEIRHFKKRFLEALVNDTAAIFAGAGLSSPSGYVDWNELLCDIASEIKLDIKKETDLVAVAQYYLNEKGNRSRINQEIINKFTKSAELTENHRILSRLPIKYYWTTNYDTLIEDSLKANNKKIDVKITPENLATNIPKRDVIIYKMHGDVSQPGEAVITKDDYELYNTTSRQLFTVALKGDLVSKNFLFIGISFNDPNIDYILSRIRVLLEKNTREHYAFFKKIKRKEYNSNKKYQYDSIKQELKLKDLKRYSINAVLVDNYKQITGILSDIEKLNNLNNVFISGSAEIYGEWEEIEAKNFMHSLAKELVRNNKKIISGFGYGVGSYIINGALSEIYESKFKNINEYLDLRPFSQATSQGINLEKLKESYRKDMISCSGIGIFLFGNKKEDNQIVDTKGVYREFELAKEKQLYIIPVGSTGFVAKRILDEIKDNIDRYRYLEKYLEVLEKENNVKNIIQCIMKIIEDIYDNCING
jgi:hypothetical protein